MVAVLAAMPVLMMSRQLCNCRGHVTMSSGFWPYATGCSLRTRHKLADARVPHLDARDILHMRLSVKIDTRMDVTPADWLHDGLEWPQLADVSQHADSAA